MHEKNMVEQRNTGEEDSMITGLQRAQLQRLERQLLDVEELLTQEARKEAIVEAKLCYLKEENGNLRGADRMEEATYEGSKEISTGHSEKLDTATTGNDQNNPTEHKSDQIGFVDELHTWTPPECSKALLGWKRRTAKNLMFFRKNEGLNANYRCKSEGYHHPFP